MTLKEAIQHAEEKANDISSCEQCRAEHKQLAEWLKKLDKAQSQTADEMFKNLGYTLKRQTVDFRLYKNDFLGWERRIMISPSFGAVKEVLRFDSWLGLQMNPSASTNLTLKELKAVAKAIEEMEN